MVFCFVQNFFFGQHKNSNIYFFVAINARKNFPVSNIRLYDKNSESDYFFFLHQNQNIFLEKNHNPPFKLNGRSLICKFDIETFKCNIHLIFTVCLSIHFFFRVKPVREGERRSRRKLGLAPEFKAEDLPVRTRRPRVLVQVFEPVPVVQTPVFVPVVQTPVFVPVEATLPELPRDLQNPVVVSPVVRLFSLPTAAVNSADVDNKTMAAIGQGVVAEAPCVALEEVVAAEQVFEAIDIIPVVPVALAPQRGWTRWFCGAALAVGNMIVNDRPVFF